MFEFAPGWGWLFWSYSVGTLFGLFYGYNYAVHKVTEKIIDSLIEQKMLKTEGHGSNMEIIPWTEWVKEEDKF